MGLLTGCVQSVVFGDVNAATARVLAAAGYDVAAPPQGCCGALSAHAGRAAESARFGESLRRSFDGVETIVVNASGCGSHLKDHGFPALDVTEALRDSDLAALHPLELTVAYQDSCHSATRNGSRPRGIPFSSGSLASCRRARRAGHLLRFGGDLQRRAAGGRAGPRRPQGGAVLAAAPDAYASANPGCLVQVAQALGRAGRPLPALHPVQLLDASIRGVGAADLLAQARR